MSMPSFTTRSQDRSRRIPGDPARRLPWAGGDRNAPVGSGDVATRQFLIDSPRQATGPGQAPVDPAEWEAKGGRASKTGSMIEYRTVARAFARDPPLFWRSGGPRPCDSCGNCRPVRPTPTTPISCADSVGHRACRRTVWPPPDRRDAARRHRRPSGRARVAFDRRQPCAATIRDEVERWLDAGSRPQA